MKLPPGLFLFVILLLGLLFSSSVGGFVREGLENTSLDTTYQPPTYPSYGGAGGLYTSLDDSTQAKALSEQGYDNETIDQMLQQWNTNNEQDEADYLQSLKGGDGNDFGQLDSVAASTQPNPSMGAPSSIFQGPNGQQVLATGRNTVQGIPGSQVPQDQEDLYILKSEVVPPVCPACPAVTTCPRQKPCQPCPACARCPEPAFRCQKVPNYRSSNQDYLPRPVLNDFSQFGM
jgi:hypothetical protein